MAAFGDYSDASGARTAAPALSFLPAPATTRLRPTSSLFGVMLRRQGGRRSVSAVVAVLFFMGVAFLAYPALTDIFNGTQKHVVNRFGQQQFQTLYEQQDVPVGDGLTQLIIDNDRVKVNVLVVQGTTLAALRAGAGHYVNTPYPCGQGNVGIAGHRTTYGRPFNRIDEMRAGDTVTLVTPLDRCVYKVVPSVDGHSNPWIVLPTDGSVISQAGVLGSGHWLTLTSCNPKGSASHRIILRLIMISDTKTTQSSAATPTASPSPSPRSTT